MEAHPHRGELVPLSPSDPSMRTVTVFLTHRCNQGCGFCTFRRPEDPPGFTDAARIRAEIEAAAGRGAQTLVLSGGEPTLMADLPSHVGAAARAGIERIVVETNGMVLAYPARARALAEAGVTCARVALPAADAARADAITQTPGGFALALRGARTAREAGIEVEISVPITPASLDGLPSLPGVLRDALGEPVDLLLRMITEAEARWVPSYAEAARAVMALVDAARERGMTARFDGRHAIPLCFFEERRRYPELFAEGAPRQGHGFTRIDACDGCAARAKCPGIPAAYRAIHGVEEARAVPERQARFVAGLGRDRRRAVEDELVNDNWFGQGGGGVERVLRINFHCNQACGFCFVDRTLPAVSAERIEREIRSAAADGVALLSLSGGEPTLHPLLPDFVALATREGLRTQIQTNAVRCADAPLTRRLADAGLEQAFVSLHAATAATSDALTAAPGTYEKTLAGVDALLGAGVAVILNFVVTGDNHRELPAFAERVAGRWGGAALSVNLSFVHASTDLVPRDDTMIPRLAEVRASIDRALGVLREASIEWRGFDGQCGIPLCLLGDDWYDVEALQPLPSAEPPAGFLKTPACARCGLTDRCVGLRESYAALYGVDELSPR